MAREIERRVLTASVELRAKGKGKMLVGYGAMFGVHSEDLGGFVEQIAPGAFDETLAAGVDVLARAEHDSRMLLGRSSSGTLRLSIDTIGLRYEVDLPDTTAGRDTEVLCERGDIKQSSFAFIIEDPERDQSWGVTAEGVPLRTLNRVSLVDVAPVASPAYPQTTVSARALDTAKAKGVVQPMKPVKPKASRADFDRALQERKIRHLTEEQRAKSYEEKLQAIWNALYELLGSPWMEATEPWYLEATYDDRVIVEKGYRYLSYPLSWSAEGAPVFGEPTQVEVEYVPSAAAGGARKSEDEEPPTPASAPAPGPAPDPEPPIAHSINENRLKLAAL